MTTLGKYCKEKGITLTFLIEKSGVQKGTLESRWSRGKKKEIDCLIKGAKDHPNIERAVEMQMDKLKENAKLILDLKIVTSDRDRLLVVVDDLAKQLQG